MPTLELTSADFSNTISRDGIVLVDFWAAWCGPCRMFAPVFEAAAEANEDIVFAKVDTEANSDIAAEARITSIPTLMAFRDGVLVYSQPGALPAPALDRLIEQVRGLDIDEARAKVTQQDSGQG